MKQTLTAAVVVLALAACQPAAVEQAPAPVAAAVQPEGAPDRAPFENCAWEKVESASFIAWGQACAFPDGAKSGFLAGERAGLESLVDVRTSAGGASPTETVVAQIFPISADAGLDAVAAQLGAMGALKPDAGCSFASLGKTADAERFVLQPAGAAAAAYDKAVASGGDMPAPPCGAYGVGPVGDRVFEVRAARPDLALYLDLGSELQAYDPDGIVLKPAG